MRFPHVLTVWVDFDLPRLDARLDARVDDMLQAGALKEMSEICEGVLKEGG
jgi:tRNA A37 N6-isopentenylltransferase MiaA